MGPLALHGRLMSVRSPKTAAQVGEAEAQSLPDRSIA
jgi:hypothetical protein